MADLASKRRRIKVDKYSASEQYSAREEELYQLAIQNSKLETKLATQREYPIPDAPTFRPTAEEFADPLAYIEAIRAEAEPYGVVKVVPPPGWKNPTAVDWASERRFATKKQRLDHLGEAFPFGDGKNYTLAEYREMADAFAQAWLQKKQRTEHTGPALFSGLEEDYWDAVDRGAEPVEVEYGNDVDAVEFFSGFPKPEGGMPAGPAGLAGLTFEDAEYYRKCGWNLHNIARWPGSLLKHFSAPLPGVTSPWLYLGMLFSTFSWHNEDNYLSSINYHHAGAPKQWYGVPGAAAAEFEDVVRRFYKQRLLEVPDLLHRINLQLSPMKLAALRVPVYRLRQNPGEFVVTYPQAFHGGFSYGFNCGEAVNFALPHWIEHARLAKERYRRVPRMAVLAHDRLMFTLLNCQVDELDDGGQLALRRELKRLLEEDLALRNRLFRAGVRSIAHLCSPPENRVDAIDAASQDYDDKRVCAACKHTCFLSAVACECSQTDVCCLRHEAYICKCPPSSKYLIEWEPREKLEKLLGEINAALPPEEPKKGKREAPSRAEAPAPAPPPAQPEPIDLTGDAEPEPTLV